MAKKIFEVPEIEKPVKERKPKREKKTKSIEYVPPLRADFYKSNAPFTKENEWSLCLEDLAKEYFNSYHYGFLKFTALSPHLIFNDYVYMRGFAFLTKAHEVFKAISHYIEFNTWKADAIKESRNSKLKSK